MSPIVTPAPSPLHLSVVVPAFNEVGRIGRSVTRILAYLDAQPFSSELIVVLDGGAPGAQTEVAASSQGRSCVTALDNVRNRGKGYSVRRGIAASSGRYVLFADADLSLPIEDAGRFLECLEEGADLAIGSRAVAGASEGGERQPWRRFMSRVFNGIVRTVAVPRLRDTQCGFKAFRGECARQLFAVQRIDGFGFDVEILRIAHRRHLRIVEVPVACEYHPTSSVRKVRHAVTMMLDLARILWHDARGHYDARG